MWRVMCAAPIPINMFLTSSFCRSVNAYNIEEYYSYASEKILFSRRKFKFGSVEASEQLPYEFCSRSKNLISRVLENGTSAR